MGVLHRPALAARGRARRRGAGRVRCPGRCDRPDLRIAELAMTSGCATLLVLNKWNLAGDDFDLDHERARVNSSCAAAPPRAHRQRPYGAPRRPPAGRVPRAGRPPPRPDSTPSSTAFAGDVAARQPPRRPGRRLKLLLHGPDRHAPPRFTIQVNSLADRPRLGLLPREPAARALPPRRRSAGDRLLWASTAARRRDARRRGARRA